MRYRLIAILIVIVAVLTGVGFGIARVLQSRKLHDLAVGQLKRQDVKVTVIEGRRWEEVAAQLSAVGVTSYTDFKTIMQAHPDYEGTLQPDTYRFFPNTAAQSIIDVMRADFTQRTNTLSPSASDLVLASIVEREAANDTDRPIIAGVYANRLKVGMTMGADPSVQYAKDSLAYKAAGYPESFVFWTAITQADYHNVVSPFNTYLQTGLPPSPICNPSFASIQAAQSPTITGGYLFFGYKNGKLLLAKTLSDHQAQLR